MKRKEINPYLNVFPEKLTNGLNLYYNFRVNPYVNVE